MPNQPMDEAERCLAELMEAHKRVEAAARFLRSAPTADLITKSAVETEVGQISMHLDAIIRRLDELPSAR